MADLVDAKEAAALWGCTERNIHHYVRMGRLVPVLYVERVTEHPTQGRRVSKVAMLSPADVLRVRAQRKRAMKIIGARRSAANHDTLQRHRTALLKAYWQMPKELRKGKGWMRKAYDYLHRSVECSGHG
jgi:hypothetical protein